MLTKPSRRETGRVLAVLTVLVSLSGVARAQQSGLFPLHPIRRERVPCSMEDPVYKLYRSQFYGYYPTQWRPFPQGWNLPSPEGPNTKQALEKQPIEASATPSPEGEGEEGPGPAQPDRGTRPAPMPPPENERSPFEMDRPDGGAAAPGAGAPPRRTPPRGNPPQGAQPSPFETPAPDQGNAPDPTNPRIRAPQPNRPAAPGLPNTGTPDLAPPGAAPEAPPRTLRNDEADDPWRDRDSGPLLAMPDASLPSVEEANALGGVAPPLTPAVPAATSPVADAAAPAELPAQPATRRSRLGSLFAGLGFNRLRR
jgi:hypothetical protein